MARAKNKTREQLGREAADLGQRLAGSPTADAAVCPPRVDEGCQAILGQLEVAYYEADLAGNLTFCSDALASILGRPSHELVGANCREYTSTQRSRTLQRRFRDVYRTGRSAKEIECQVEAKGGRPRFVSLSVSLIQANSHAATGFRGIVQDITERKRAEEALRQSEERYRTIIENMHDAYFEMDLKGNLTFFNDALCKLHGRSREDLIGRNNREYMDEETARRTSSVFKEVHATGQPARNMTWKWTQPGQPDRWFEYSVSLIRNAAGQPTGFRGISREITEQIQHEEALQKAKEAADAANRAKSEFLANMSHEIRTPMNGIIGMTELTLETDLTSEQRDNLEMVRASTDSLLSLINDILDFSKIEAGKLELDPISFDLRDSVEDTLKTLALRAHQKGLELACDVRPDVPGALFGDPGRLRQILVNLVGNAIKFTKQGEVVVSVEVAERGRDDSLLHFAVGDTGVGIPPDKQRMIFEPFSQADGSTTRRHGGTGLGLTISSKLVAIMGGQIWVESEPGLGSVFHFTARFGLQRNEVSEVASIPKIALRGMPVLIVDDNATNRRILNCTLANWGIGSTAVESAEQALQALAHARDAGGPFALILLDAQMPEMDGFSLASTIKENPGLTGAAIMMLSSSGRPGDAARCRDLGIAGYLTKPVKQSELLNAILTVLGAPAAETTRKMVVTRHSLREDRKRYRILLAEDNSVNQKLAARLLEKAGHQVTVAADGLQAVAAVEIGGFDLILMDVQMPEMNGYEATAVIREREKSGTVRVPILALTAHAMKGDRERCLDAGMDGYISKPIKARELLDAIDRLPGLRAGVAPGREFIEDESAEPDYRFPSDRRGTSSI